MKTSLFSSILCASLMVFAVGCGKDNSSGGGGSSRNNLSYDKNYLSPDSKVAIDNLNRWYNGTAEGTTQNYLAYANQVKKRKYELVTTQPQQNCEEKKFLGIPFNYCQIDYDNGSQPVAVAGSEGTFNLSDNRRINEKNNPELQGLFNKSYGQLVNVTQTGNVFRLDFLKSDNSLVTYYVDKSFHSQLNPRQKTEIISGQAKSIITEPVPYY